jgi:hypothetical protein
MSKLEDNIIREIPKSAFNNDRIKQQNKENLLVNENTEDKRRCESNDKVKREFIIGNKANIFPADFFNCEILKRNIKSSQESNRIKQDNKNNDNGSEKLRNRNGLHFKNKLSRISSYSPDTAPYQEQINSIFNTSEKQERKITEKKLSELNDFNNFALLNSKFGVILEEDEDKNKTLYDSQKKFFVPSNHQVYGIKPNTSRGFVTRKLISRDKDESNTNYFKEKENTKNSLINNEKIKSKGNNNTNVNTKPLQSQLHEIVKPEVNCHNKKKLRPISKVDSILSKDLNSIFNNNSNIPRIESTTNFLEKKEDQNIIPKINYDFSASNRKCKINQEKPSTSNRDKRKVSDIKIHKYCNINSNGLGDKIIQNSNFITNCVVNNDSNYYSNIIHINNKINIRSDKFVLPKINDNIKLREFSNYKTKVKEKSVKIY